MKFANSSQKEGGAILQRTCKAMFGQEQTVFKIEVLMMKSMHQLENIAIFLLAQSQQSPEAKFCLL